MMTCSSLIILSEKEKKLDTAVPESISTFIFTKPISLGSWQQKSQENKNNKTAEKVNSFIKLVKLKFIDNGAITDKHLGRSGLHLNRN